MTKSKLFTLFILSVFLMSEATLVFADDFQNALDSFGVGQGQSNSETISGGTGQPGGSSSRSGSSGAATGRSTTPRGNQFPTGGSGSSSTSSSSGSSSTSSTSSSSSTTVTNSSTSDTAFVRTKTESGEYGFVAVAPGATVTLPSNVARVRINSNTPGSISVSGPGGSFTLGQDDTHQSGGSILLQPPARNVVVRGNNGTVILPELTEGELRMTVAGQVDPAIIRNLLDYNLGTGSPPAASDGAVSYPGNPTGYSRVKAPTSPGEPDLRMYDLTDEDYKELREMGYRTDKQIANFLDTEAGFYWYMSGSGGMFGDGVGTDYYSFNRPGYPRQGLPVGSWVDWTSSRTVYSDDQFLISALQAGDASQFKQLFEGAYGEFQEDVFAG